MFEVEWTGEWPCLCSGEWIIKKNGVVVNIPEHNRKSSMNTFGTYSSWHFNEDWLEEFDDYEDGEHFEEWIIDNPWVLDIASTIEEQKELYSKIQQQDWRHGSCGGCI